MFRLLFLLFLVVPVFELWGLISVGKLIGGWQTVALVILTGLVGAFLAKQQGLQTLRLIQLQLSRGQMPTDALIDGFLILIGGLLLLMPGFFTDVVGLIMMLPFTRMIIRHLLKGWLIKQIASGKIMLLFRR